MTTQSLPQPRRRWLAPLVLALLLIPATILTFWNIAKGAYYRATDTAGPVEGIAWQTDFATAQALAQKTGKPLLIDVSASWCPPCQVMKHETWPDPRVQKLANDHFIPVFIDADSDAAAPIAQRYGITTIPSIIIATPAGTPTHRAGFLTADQMTRLLTQSQNPS